MDKLTEMKMLYDACMESASCFIAKNEALNAYKALLHAEITNIRILNLIAERG